MRTSPATRAPNRLVASSFAFPTPFQDHLVSHRLSPRLASPVNRNRDPTSTPGPLPPGAGFVFLVYPSPRDQIKRGARGGVRNAAEGAARFSLSPSFKEGGGVRRGWGRNVAEGATEDLLGLSRRRIKTRCALATRPVLRLESQLNRSTVPKADPEGPRSPCVTASDPTIYPRPPPDL